MDLETMNMPVVSIDINMFWQIINFCILLFIFNKFVKVPVAKMLESRKEAIVSNLSSAEEAKKEAEKNKQEANVVLMTARKEATELVTSAERKAVVRQEEIIKEAHEQKDKILKSAEAEVVKMKESLKKELEVSVRETAAMMAAELLHKKLGTKDKDALLNEFIEEVGEVKW